MPAGRLASVFLYNSEYLLIVIGLSANGVLLEKLSSYSCTFSRHGRAETSFTLLIWLNENVGFHPAFSRHGRVETSFTLLIWLDENVLFLVSAVFFCRIDVKEHACHDK